MPPALTIRNLRTEFSRGDQRVTPVDGVSLEVESGECVGLVGESGCGKSLTLRSIVGLLPNNARVIEGEVELEGKLISAKEAPSIRGHGVSVVFQEPGAALNPVMRVGDFIAEGLRTRGRVNRGDIGQEAVRLMREVGIPNPERRARAWPHELSGGMKQRVMIAAALATEPRVLLADEPTTALDVTVQDQILGLLDELRRTRGLAVLFVSHDLAVVRQVAQRIFVMYAGRCIESGSTRSVLANPQHPYTQGLVASVSDEQHGQRLRTIDGAPPAPQDFTDGCRFRPRCFMAQPDCADAPFAIRPSTNGHATACIHWKALTNGAEK